MNKLQIVALADQQTFATSHDIKEDLDSEDVKINERTIRLRLNEAGAKFKIQQANVEAYAYGQASIKSYKMGT